MVRVEKPILETVPEPITAFDEEQSYVAWFENRRR
jgi:hypothetical protein